MIHEHELGRLLAAAIAELDRRAPAAVHFHDPRYLGAEPAELRFHVSDDPRLAYVFGHLTAHQFGLTWCWWRRAFPAQPEQRPVPEPLEVLEQ